MGEIPYATLVGGCQSLVVQECAGFVKYLEFGKYSTPYCCARFAGTMSLFLMLKNANKLLALCGDTSSVRQDVVRKLGISMLRVRTDCGFNISLKICRAAD